MDDPEGLGVVSAAVDSLAEVGRRACLATRTTFVANGRSSGSSSNAGYLPPLRPRTRWCKPGTIMSHGAVRGMTCGQEEQAGRLERADRQLQPAQDARVDPEDRPPKEVAPVRNPAAGAL